MNRNVKIYGDMIEITITHCPAHYPKGVVYKKRYKTAKGAAEFYAHHSAMWYFNDKLNLPYWSNPEYKPRVYRRVLPIFKKLLP